MIIKFLLSEVLPEMLEHSKYSNHLYYYCASQIWKLIFCSMWLMAKLKPAQLKIAPFPISLDVKCLWLVNKSILWKISFCFVIVTFLIHHRMINFSQIMWVHQQQEDDRLVNVSWVDHLHQRHDLNSRHYVKHSVIRVSSDPFRDKEFYRIFPHRGDNGSRTKPLFWHILRSEVFQINKCSIFEKQMAKKALFVHIIPDV